LWHTGGVLLNRPPCAALREYVDSLWITDGYVPPGAHRQERILPSGQSNLVIDLLGGPPILGGAYSQAFALDTAAQFAVAGVCFKPGGAYPFISAPLAELTNGHAPLDALWGRWAEELRERVLAAPTPSCQLDALERVLIERLGRGRRGRPEVAYALAAFCRTPGTAKLAEVTEQIGLSHRRFLDLFAAEVGLTPKVFCRVRRFHRSISHVAAGRRVDWTALALDCGYHDQAHFIHDFRAFSGASPTYYELHRIGVNHLAVDAAA
jgi:AraC-like DNA-binding protein